MVKYTKRRKIRGGNVKCANESSEIAEFEDGHVCGGNYPLPVYTSREGKDLIQCPNDKERILKCKNNKAHVRYPEQPSGKCPDGYNEIYSCTSKTGSERSTAKITHNYNPSIQYYSNKYEEMTGKQSPLNSPITSPRSSSESSFESSFESLPQGGKRRRTRKNKRRGRKSRKHYRRK
jgi:hypothetical protein